MLKVPTVVLTMRSPRIAIAIIALQLLLIATTTPLISQAAGLLVGNSDLLPLTSSPYRSSSRSRSHEIPAVVAWRRWKRRKSRVGQLPAQRQICEFELSDFALATGEWPYTDEEDMARLDSSNDKYFYNTPRFVTHIDDRAIQSLTNFYREEMAALLAQKKKKDGTSDNNGVKSDVLDLCCSWISHLPDDDDIPFGRVVGVGMNEEELQANEQLTEYFVQDLNDNPQQLRQLFDDESFDVICNAVSVDYLTRPREIFQEMYRILRPGGIALISFSNRCFPSKAIKMWLDTDDIGRMTIVGSYFHYTAPWKHIVALDILPPKQETPKAPKMQEMLSNPAKGFAWMTAASAVQKQNIGDPIYVIKAVK